MKILPHLSGFRANRFAFRMSPLRTFTSTPTYLNQVRRLENIKIRAYFTHGPALSATRLQSTSVQVCAEYPSTITISDVHCTHPLPSHAPRSFPHLLARYQRHWHVIWQGGRRRRRFGLLRRVLWHCRDGHQLNEFRRPGDAMLSKSRRRDSARFCLHGPPFVVFVDRALTGLVQNTRSIDWSESTLCGKRRSTYSIVCSSWARWQPGQVTPHEKRADDACRPWSDQNWDT